MGFLVYEETKPPRNAVLGSWVEGQIYVGIDSFRYVEELNKLPGMPDLTYGFRVEQIFLEKTPWIMAHDEYGREVMSRDDQNDSCREVSETDAWSDDNGNAHYVLKCVCIERPKVTCCDR